MTRWLLLIVLLTLASPVAAVPFDDATGRCWVQDKTTSSRGLVSLSKPRRYNGPKADCLPFTASASYFTAPSIPAGREPTEAEVQQLFRDLEAPCPPGLGREWERCSKTKDGLITYLMGVSQRQAERDALRKRDARLLSQIRQIVREEIQAWSGKQAEAKP